MTTIEEVRNLIAGFKIDPNEIYHYLNKGPGHAAYVSFKAKQFATNYTSNVACTNIPFIDYIL